MTDSVTFGIQISKSPNCEPAIDMGGGSLQINQMRISLHIGGVSRIGRHQVIWILIIPH